MKRGISSDDLAEMFATFRLHSPLFCTVHCRRSAAGWRVSATSDASECHWSTPDSRPLSDNDPIRLRIRHRCRVNGRHAHRPASQPRSSGAGQPSTVSDGNPSSRDRDPGDPPGLQAPKGLEVTGALQVVRCEKVRRISVPASCDPFCSIPVGKTWTGPFPRCCEGPRGPRSPLAS